MKKANPYYLVFLLSLLLIPAMLFSSCSNDDEPDDTPEQTTQTVLMYFPWAGSGIYPYFLENISAFETAIKNNNGLNGRQLMVFICPNTSQAHLINISYKNRTCVRDTLKTYNTNASAYTTSDGIASILNEVKAYAPAEHTAMIIGCHGMGWIPSGTTVARVSGLMKAKSMNYPLTRFFGHSDDSRYQTDITTLAEGIKSTGIRMDYILFDDCYMSNIETAYDLKDVTDYMVASTCEVMIKGMPYDVIGGNLLRNDLDGVCQGFYNFYSTYSTPCGTIGVTDCREVEAMAQIMKTINTTYPQGLDDVSSLQRLDGLTPTVFFDFGDYVSKLCEDEGLLAQFNNQLEKLVPYKACTPTYYSSYTGRQVNISTFSGLTVSTPTKHSVVATKVPDTNWYKATH